MIRPPKVALFAFSLWISTVAVLSASAQQPSLPQLTVQVTDQLGAVIPGALVTIIDSAGALKTAAYTKPDGSALFPIASGHYGISARADGFLSSRTDIDYPKANTATLALPISTIMMCGPCVNPTPIFLETTPPVITALIEPDKRSWFPLHWTRRD